MSSRALSTAWPQLYKWRIKDLDERSSAGHIVRFKVYILVYIFLRKVFAQIFGFWYEWHGYWLVSWLCTEKITCNDIVLLRSIVDVTDANVCYGFQVFQSLICRWHACLYPSVSVTFVFVSFYVICHHVSNGTFTRWKSYIVTNEIYLKRESN